MKITNAMLKYHDPKLIAHIMNVVSSSYDLYDSLYVGSQRFDEYLYKNRQKYVVLLGIHLDLIDEIYNKIPNISESILIKWMGVLHYFMFTSDDYGFVVNLKLTEKYNCFFVVDRTKVG